MIVVSVQLAPWDNLPRKISRAKGGQLIDNHQFSIEDQVIIKTEIGTDLGKIIKIEQGPIEDSSDENHLKEENKSENNFILRKANPGDLKAWEEKNKENKRAIKKSQSLAKGKKLSMKIIDALFSFDGGRIIFAFTASTRVDFRELVKELVKEFHKSIRMYHVGARQETGLEGTIGPCGRKLCCTTFLEKLGNVTTEMMLDQQLSHRGSERLTGPCGRLRCCLAFEEKMYKESAQNLPPIGSKIKTKQGQGQVIDWHILKQTVVIKKKGKKGEEVTRVEVSLSDIESQLSK